MSHATYVRMDFKTKLQLHMRAQRLSQEAVAKALDVSQGLVSGWCRGKYKPDINQGLALAKLLKLSLDYLVDETLPALPADLVDREREVRSVLQGIGIEEAWRRLVGAERPGAEPRLIPPPTHQVSKGESA